VYHGQLVMWGDQGDMDITGARPKTSSGGKSRNSEQGESWVHREGQKPGGLKHEIRGVGKR